MSEKILSIKLLRGLPTRRGKEVIISDYHLRSLKGKGEGASISLKERHVETK